MNQIREELDKLADTIESICGVKCDGGEIWSDVVRINVTGKVSQDEVNRLYRLLKIPLSYIPSQNVIEIKRG